MYNCFHSSLFNNLWVHNRHSLIKKNIYYKNMQTWKKECIHGTFKIYEKKTIYLFQDRF